MSPGRVRTDIRRTRSHTHKRVKCPVWKNVRERLVKHFQYVPRTGKSSPFSLLLFFSIFSVSSCFYSTRRWNDSYRKWNGLMGRTFKGFESRRRGVYHVACLSMKCYFKVSQLPLSSLPLHLSSSALTALQLSLRMIWKASYLCKHRQWNRSD
jgi:hypothetical protein